MHDRTPISPDDVSTYAQQLREYATHFEMRDWCYTRQTGIRHIRRHGDWSGYDHPWRRLKRTAQQFLPRRWQDNLREMLGMESAYRHPWLTIRSGMRTPEHAPDGILDGGNIIANWEETGEYLQYVQPSVGEMLADWMQDEPDNPHALRIADEMRRINDDYGQRVTEEGTA